MLLATALVAASCSNEEGAEYNDAGRSAIELGGANAVTRAGFTEANTTLKLHYVSTKVNASATDGKTDEPLYMTSSATAEMNADKSETSVSTVNQTTGDGGEKRYWDDIHGKNSNLAIYAIAVANKTSITNNTNATAFNAWDTKQKEGTAEEVANTLAWTVSTDQTLETIADEDITYSNNVKNLRYNTSAKAFDKAEGTKSLVFNHALSRFTINIKKGNGFDDFEKGFNVTVVKLSGFNTTGTINVETGEVTSSTTTDIEAVGSKVSYPATGTQEGYTFKAQVFPGTTIKSVATTMFTIVVDGNNYLITGDQIFQSLKSNNTSMTAEELEELETLQPGKNYNLTVNINKTAIEIMSAKLVDWETINGTEMTPSNAIALTTTMEQTAGNAANVVASDLYRSTALATGYTEKTTLAADGKTMGTTWYWPNNSTSYYLRTISPQNTVVDSSSDPNTNTITMTGGAIADANDYIWGAPLVEKHGAAPHSFTYDNGYGAYLHPAIGPTKSEIHLTQFHMMSNIEVNLTTSEGDDKVDLTNATVEILNYDNSATLALSNAAITLSGSKTETSGAITTTDHLKHTWRVIPQSVTGITLKITAAGNVYNVTLPANTDIESWLPGKSYVYTFKLLKTAINITSAKLVDWEKVTAQDKTITLE